MYVLKLALRPWRQAWLSQLTSVFSVGFLIFSCTLLIWLERGLGPVIHRLRSEQVLTAYLMPSFPQKSEAELKDQIRVTVGSSTTRSIDVELTTAEGFLSQLKESYPQLAAELSDLKGALPSTVATEAAEAKAAEGDSLLPRYITVSGVLSSEVIAKIRGLAGIEAVESSEGRFRSVAGAFSTVRWLARFLAVGLLLALFNSLIHLAKAHSAFHSQTSSILNLWGADSFHAKLPCALSGFSVGILGGITAAIAWVPLSSVLRDRIQTLSPALRDLPQASILFALGACVAGALLGLSCGILGCSVRTRNLRG